MTGKSVNSIPGPVSQVNGNCVSW